MLGSSDISQVHFKAEKIPDLNIIISILKVYSDCEDSSFKPEEC